MNSEQVFFQLRARLEVVDALYRFGAGIDFNNDDLLTSALAPDVIVDFTRSNKLWGLEFPISQGRDRVEHTRTEELNMDLQLKGKRALITGSSSGIGKAIAIALAQEGVAVVIQGRRQKEVERVAQEITASGGKAAMAIGDLTQNAEAQQVVDTALAAFNRIDILINNAGAFPFQGWMEATVEDWMQNFDTNVFSMVRMIRLLVPQMKQGGWGRMIQISSNAGVQAVPYAASYSATKAANINMTVSLAKELANTGITVNTVSPGPVITEGWTQAALEIAQKQGWGTDLEIIRHLRKSSKCYCDWLWLALLELVT